MKAIGITELKAHLSDYLRKARAGQVITVLDRDTPIVTLGPFRPEESLDVRRATRAARDLTLPRRPAMSTDSLAALVGDRLRR
jgi:prevent-host-death family protein